MRITNTHVYFWGSYLSNFYWQPFTARIRDQDFYFHTSEQYYMAMKAAFFKDEIAFHQTMDAPDAKSAKAFGRTVRNFDQDRWDMISTPIMDKACMLKFEAGEHKQKISKSMKGKNSGPKSEEHQKKITESLKGKNGNHVLTKLNEKSVKLNGRTI
jgi:ribA/ribD-fused uncharacterized protein